MARKSKQATAPIEQYDDIVMPELYRSEFYLNDAMADRQRREEAKRA